MIRVELGFAPKLTDLLTRLVDSLRRPHYTITGGIFMYIVPDDQPDVKFTLSPVSILDAEGQSITGFTEELTSDAPDVVELILNDEKDIHAGGTLHFGAPGVANLNYNITVGDTVLPGKGAQFTVTTGQPASVSGGEFAFEGLKEE